MYWLPAVMALPAASASSPILATRSASFDHSSIQALSRSASPARALSRRTIRSISAIAAAPYATMPLTICVALLQRRLPGNVTGQLPSLGIETMALSLCQFFEGPLRAGEQLSVVVALADELCADWHAGRSLEDRDRNGR